MDYSFLIALHSLWLTQSQLKKLFLTDVEWQVSRPEDWVEGRPQWGDTYRHIFESLSRDFLIKLGWKSDEKITEVLQKIEHYDFQKQAALIEKCEVKIITWESEQYPMRLKQIGHAPYFLYVRGNLQPEMPLIAIVGSRKNTTYGKKNLEKIIPELISHGYGIVSGGAYGIDTLAHQISLDNNGYTISVLGTGIDKAYPAQNIGMFRTIIERGGAVISHFPLGTKPELYNFPMRNEIVAALSLGVLIPEAAEGSGTIITAQLALEHGRDVFAIPGDIDRETSGGTNRLIATGQAKCVVRATDILEEYEDIASWEKDNITVPVFEDEIQAEIYEAILKGYWTLDEISGETGLALMEVMEKIALLEILGHISMESMTGRYGVR